MCICIVASTQGTFGGTVFVFATLGNGVIVVTIDTACTVTAKPLSKTVGLEISAFSLIPIYFERIYDFNQIIK
jgi:hypothetical protein